MSIMHFDDWFPVWIEGGLKAAALLALAWIVAWAARRSSAANRSAIWLAALVGVLVLPLVIVLAGLAWKTGAGDRMAPLVVYVPVERVAPVATEGAHAAGKSEVVAGVWDRLPGWRVCLLGVWAAGVVFLLGRRMAAAWQLRRLRNRAAPLPEGRVAALAEALEREMTDRLTVDWRMARAGGSALTWGTFRPVILLPAGVGEWDDARLKRVLRHELAHVARRDSLARLVAQVACALYWPLPPVWIGARCLRELQELACDDRVLSSGAVAADYADDLVAAARRRGRAAWGAVAVSMAESSTLERRIVALLDDGRSRVALRRRTVAGATIMVGFVLVGCTGMQVRGASSMPASAIGAEGNPRSIEIEAKFVEFEPSSDPMDRVRIEALRLENNDGGRGPLVAVMSGEAAAKLLHDLGARRLSDIVSAPRVTVSDGQPAKITVGQELRFPAGGPVLGTTDATLKPGAPARAPQIRNVGVELDVMPKLTPAGRLMVDLAPTVREFEGFVAFTAPPASGGDAGAAGAGADKTAYQPIFSERRWRNLVGDVESGQVVVLTTTVRREVLGGGSAEEQEALQKLGTRPGAGPDGVKAEKPDKDVWVFVTVRVIDSSGARVGQAAAAKTGSGPTGAAISPL